MTTLVVSGAQALGGALVQTASAAALSFANSAITQLFDNRIIEGPRLKQFQLMSSRDGTPMPRSYGRVRLAGQVIWASRLKETVTTESRSGKGGPSQRDYNYSISFALGLCEGEIKSVDRFWVNGQPLTTAGLTFRIYPGTEDQFPDPIISVIDGDVPAFRGTAYVVFEDFPLDDYGGRLPQFNAEVTRVPPSFSESPRLENLVTGVHLLPSSGEFVYATDIIEDISSPGTARPINMNNISGQADINLALDQLEEALPECKNVSLVISWFGDDLRAGECKLRPGVESRTRLLDGGDWAVSGQTRETAYVVSTDNQGRPIYGGTPSDASILQAIRELKSRGYKVMIYPFILMDIPAGNDLPDPYGGQAQATFPWRGRITCHPAAGQANTADQTAAAQLQVEDFFGNAAISDFTQDEDAVIYSGDDEGLRRFILHYAKLAQIAGGVERFVISSEMVGLTTVRRSRTAYPAVEKLRDLLSDVRALLPQTQLSYAADWSEYFGHHPRDGREDVNFHLDPLWADENLDAIGIDAYFPLSDWRGGAHLDEDLAGSIYDVDYLSSNLRRGEGFEFYYKTPEDRAAQIRTPITDGAYRKDWVFRYKDLFNWWSQPHFHRQDGLEAAQSDWVPRSKPFWLTEIGCPAVDKGANQPNVFYDPKSDESALPYFSSGTRDDLIQRRYLEAFLGFYGNGVNNPSSDIYDGRMIDMEGCHVWCWDARPYPDFPARVDVWADGPNWELGHWLTGRTGLVLVADVVRDLTLNSGVSAVDVSDITGVLEGVTLDRPMSTRAALGPLAMIYGFDMVERAGGLSFKSQDGGVDLNLSLDALAVADAVTPAITRTKDDPEGRIVDVRLHYIDGARDHQPASLFARDMRRETVRIFDIEVPLVMDAGFARLSAERLLTRASTLDQSVSFNLPRSNLVLEVGDRVSLPNESGVWQITRIERAGSLVDSGGAVSRVSARASAEAAASSLHVALTTPNFPPPIPWASKPEIMCLDIPNFGGANRDGVLVGVKLPSFNRAQISSGPHSVLVTQPVLSGQIDTALNIGPIGRFDYAAQFEFTLTGGEFSAVSNSALFSGENRFAVETEKGWEILQIAELTLIGPNRYRARKLLRGQSGSGADMRAVESGARIVWLGQGFETLAIDVERGEEATLSAIAAGRQGDPLTLIYQARHLRPLSPVHAKAARHEDGVSVNWIRRTRIGGDSWGGLDVPLGEDISLFRVQAFENGKIIETVETENTFAILQSQTADYLEISQGSTAYGFGAVLRADL